MNYDNEAVFGATVRLSDLEHVCSSEKLPNVERFIAISKQLKWFAGESKLETFLRSATSSPGRRFQI